MSGWAACSCCMARMTKWLAMVSVVATRYGDPAKVEKWFKRNCTEVLGRECSAREKGDWLAWMTSQ